MARTYVNSTDYSDTDAEFTFETIDNNIYLKIGNPNDDDAALIVSIIAGGLVGFFQNSERIAIARITADYDETDGIRVESIPEDLVLNEEYVVKFTQARPGRFGEPGPQGERGEQGLQGERGEQGPQGERGEQGLQGERGEQGLQGERGEQGLQGERGEQGLQGERGEQGEQGPTGPGGQPSDLYQRAECLEFQAVPSISSQYSDAISVVASNPVSILYPSGATTPAIITATGGGTSATVLNAGIYNIEWLAIIDTDAWRQLPTLAVFRDEDTIGTDTPLAIIPTRNLRYRSDDNEVYGNALIRILADNTAIKFAVTSQSGADRFSVDAGSKLIIEQIGVKGERGDDGAPGPEGPQGPQGRPGMGVTGINFTVGDWTPTVATMQYQRVDGIWFYGAPEARFVSIGGPLGRYMRWGNTVQFYGCFTVNVGSDAGNIERVRLLLYTPHNGNSADEIQGVHGVGTPASQEAGWHPLNITSGDTNSTVTQGGITQNENTSNAVRVDVIARDHTNGSRFGMLVAFSGMYTIVEDS